VQWTKITNRMDEDGVTEYYECGTDDTLQKMVRRMKPNSMVTSLIHISTYKGKIQDYSIINS